MDDKGDLMTNKKASFFDGIESERYKIIQSIKFELGEFRNAWRIYHRNYYISSRRRVGNSPLTLIWFFPYDILYRSPHLIILPVRHDPQ